MRAIVAQSERDERRRKLVMRGRYSFDEPLRRPFTAIGPPLSIASMKISCGVKSCDRDGKCVTGCLCADCVAIPIIQNRRNSMPNEDIKIAANCGVSAEDFAAMRAQTKGKPLSPNAYLVDDDQTTAGDLIDQSRDHLARMMDENDGIAPDERLDRAIECLQRAKALRAGTVGGLGQHAKVTFVR